MQLNKWLEREELTPTDFGKRIGRPQATVSRYASGKRIPEPEIMQEIVQATGGEVTPNDFYGMSGAEKAAPETAKVAP